MRKIFYTIIISIFVINNIFGQAVDLDEGNLKAARGYFQYQNFKDALNEYKKLRKNDTTNIEYNHNIALCYLYTNIDKTQAIPYLEWIVTQPKFDPNAWYDLGKAYQFANRFDDARKAFNKFIATGQKETNPISAKRQLEICDNAEKLMLSPVNVSIENMGKEINSPFPDYNPYISQDESYLVYVTKRPTNLGGWIDYDGFNTADIYHSQKINSKWKKGKGISNAINTYLVEEIVGMSSDGELMFVYMDNETAMADIFYCEKKGRSYKRPESLGSYINNKSFEGSAGITKNKKTIFFSSDREGGFGGVDLYMAYQLPSGEWGDPINLGDKINTKYDEDFPYIAPDGETFYFASTGHNSMGGYDIFKCKWNKTNKTFESDPENIGYPINNQFDNTSISFTKTGRHAYIAAVLPGGFGYQDIYRITFNDIQPKKCLLSGFVLNTDSISLYQSYNQNIIELENVQKIYDSIAKESRIDEAMMQLMYPDICNQIKLLKAQTKDLPQTTIKVFNKRTKEVQGIYRPNKNTGKYTIVIDPGEYEISYKCSGYTTINREYIFEDDESVDLNKTEHIILIPNTNETQAQ